MSVRQARSKSPSRQVKNMPEVGCRNRENNLILNLKHYEINEYKCQNESLNSYYLVWKAPTHAKSDHHHLPPWIGWPVLV